MNGVEEDEEVGGWEKMIWKWYENDMKMIWKRYENDMNLNGCKGSNDGWTAESVSDEGKVRQMALDVRFQDDLRPRVAQGRPVLVE